MQNLVLAVQNTVKASEIGTASASVSFFRSVGGAIGVSVLGAVLGNRVKELASEGLAKAGIPVTGGSAGGSMDLKDMPAPVRDIMRAAYGDATAQIFMISAIIGIVALIAILFIKEQPLRSTVDIQPAPASGGARPDGGQAVSAAAIVDLDREFIEVLSRQHENETRFPAAALLGPDRLDSDRSGSARPDADRPDTGSFDRAAGRDAGRLRARTLVADAHAETADVVPLLLRTQHLLAEQQVQLAEALRAVHEQAAEQRAITAEQARISEELTALRRQLAKERKQQRAAAEYIATHGRHRNA
jgi:hypothetical protein